jgi:hypothetical protein
MRVTIEHDSGRIESFELFPDGVKEDYKPYKDSTTPYEEVVDHGEAGKDVEPEPESDEPLDPPCFLCENPIKLTDDQYCFGCRTFICPEHPQTPWGPHEPDDHDRP